MVRICYFCVVSFSIMGFYWVLFWRYWWIRSISGAPVVVDLFWWNSVVIVLLSVVSKDMFLVVSLVFIIFGFVVFFLVGTLLGDALVVLLIVFVGDSLLFLLVEDVFFLGSGTFLVGFIVVASGAVILRSDSVLLFDFLERFVVIFILSGVGFGSLFGQSLRSKVAERLRSVQILFICEGYWFMVERI